MSTCKSVAIAKQVRRAMDVPKFYTQTSPVVLILGLLGFPSMSAARELPREEPCSGVLTLDNQAITQPNFGELLEYKLTLGGVYLGRMELSVGKPRKVEGQVAIPLAGRMKTNGFVSAIRPIEGRYMAMVDPGTLAPFGVRVESKIGDDPRWERISFSQQGRRIDTKYLYRGMEKHRAYGSAHPIIEGLSLLQIARRVRLEKGLKGCQDIFSTRRMWRVRAEVLGTELVDTPVGQKKAYRVRAKLTQRFYPKNRRAPFVDVDILIGDLPGRPPLAFEMRDRKVSGKADLIRWNPGRRG